MKLLVKDAAFSITANWEIGRVFTYGAERYGLDNWKNLENPESRCMAAALRHIAKYQMGEKIAKYRRKSYFENKEKRKEYMREYYQKNKERILKKRSFRKKMRIKYGERAKEMIILEEIKKRMLNGKKEIIGRRIITKGDWLRSGGYIDIETFSYITGKSVREIIQKVQKYGFNFSDRVHSAFLLFYDVVNVV